MLHSISPFPIQNLHRYVAWFDISRDEETLIPPLRSHIAIIQFWHVVILFVICLLYRRLQFAKCPPPKYLAWSYELLLLFHGALYAVEMIWTRLLTDTFLTVHHIASLWIFLLLRRDTGTCSIICLTPFLFHNLYHAVGSEQYAPSWILQVYNTSLVICCVYVMWERRKWLSIWMLVLTANNILYATMRTI